MTTRAELRAALRLRLEDGATGSPLWDDATLDDALASGIRAYGARLPKEAVAIVEVAAGDRAVAVPLSVGGAIDPARIVRVLDPGGAAVPRQAADEPSPVGSERLGPQAWRWWDGALLFRRPAIGGAWRIEYLAPRLVPATDGAAVDVAPGDEEIPLALALASALERRVIEDGKRGSPPAGLAALAAAARAEAGRLLTARRRRVRGGWLGWG